MNKPQEQQGALHGINANKGHFFFTFIGIFSAIFIVLAVNGLTPDPTTTSADTLSTTSQHQSDTQPASQEVTLGQGQGELPIRITAEKIKLNVTVANPSSTDVEALDTVLLKGAARYPTSAHLGEEGTMLIFGHSSYLPIVHNQSYKAFDGIQNLKEGDVVSVFSATAEYRYSVTSVTLKSATEDSIDLTQTGKHLTLVTCDSFGQKTDRFVVTADLVGTYPVK